MTTSKAWGRHARARLAAMDMSITTLLVAFMFITILTLGIAGKNVSIEFDVFVRF
jgi:hypothetical protein